MPHRSTSLPRLVAGVTIALGIQSSASAMVWPSTIEQVADQLSSEEVAERRSAAEQLKELPASAARRLLRSALLDVDPAVRVSAARAALRIRYEEAVPLVTPWLSDAESSVRLIAAQVLGEFGSGREVRAALERVLLDPEQEVRLAAAKALGELRDPQAVSPLIDRLDDASPQVQLAVIGALGKLKDPRSVLPLISKVQDTRSAVRQGVVRALGSLASQQGVAGLVLALRDSDPKVRLAAVAALGRVSSLESRNALTSVTTSEPDVSVRVAALAALGRQGDPGAVQQVIAALDSNRQEVSAAAQQILLRIAKPAGPELVSCLAGQPSPARASGCASALAVSGDARTLDSILGAWQRRVLSPEVALRALGQLGDSKALPLALAALSDEDRAVREAASIAAAALLDPLSPDGRAVEPIADVLGRSDGTIDERIAMVGLLGRTGAKRAAPIVARYAAGGTPLPLRLAALRALGELGAEPLLGADRAPPTGETRVREALLSALGDEHPMIRSEAAIALRRCGDADLAPELLSRLEGAGAEDRASLALALLGPLSRSTNQAALLRTLALAKNSAGGLRDALIEAAGSFQSEATLGELNRLFRGASAPTRAKIAEALSIHSKATEFLVSAASDLSAQVRANAVWSLGFVAQQTQVPALTRALDDADVAVAANAVAALTHVAKRLPAERQGVVGQLCESLGHRRAYVRGNALVGLRLLGARCSKNPERRLLEQDPIALVRERAALLLRATAGEEPAQDARALSLCLEQDPIGAVASACHRDPPRAQSDVRTALTVFVVPPGEETPRPEVPFALVLPSGMIRHGTTDRRGVVYEAQAPVGEVSLAIPASALD